MERNREELLTRIYSYAKKVCDEIMNVELYTTILRYHKPFEIATQRVDQEEMILVLVKTRENIIGIGEGNLPESQDEKDKILRKFVYYAGIIRESSIEEAFELFVKRISNEESYIRVPFSLAILDIIARANEMRFGELFGKILMEQILTDITIGIEPIEETIEDVKKALDEGFKAIKLKVGKGGIRKDLERIESVWKILPEGTSLRVDANQGWSLEEGKKILKEIEKRGIDIELLEQPLKRSMIREMSELRSITTIPIIADESARVTEDVYKLKGCVDGVNLKLWKAGDPVEVISMGRVARDLGMIVMIGCSSETNIGITADAYMASVIPINYADLDSDLLKEDILISKRTVLKSGYRILPKGYGLNIELNDLIEENVNKIYPT